MKTRRASADRAVGVLAQRRKDAKGFPWGPRTINPNLRALASSREVTRQKSPRFIRAPEGVSGWQRLDKSPGRLPHHRR